MKSLFLYFFCLIGLASFAQTNLSITVSQNGTPVEGVSVFLFTDKQEIFPLVIPRAVLGKYDAVTYSDANGQVVFSFGNMSVGDTVYWASHDCQRGMVTDFGVVGSSSSMTGVLDLPCLPQDCDTHIRIDTLVSGTVLFQFIPFLEYSQTGLTSGSQSQITVNGISRTGTVQSNYDSASFSPGSLSAPINVQYTRAQNQCSIIDNDPQVYLTTYFTADPVGPSGSGYTMAFNDSSFSNGAFRRYEWDFGDGTTLNGRYDSDPQHTYASTGTYRVRLGVTSISASGWGAMKEWVTNVVVGPGGGSVKRGFLCEVQQISSAGMPGTNMYDIYASPFTTGNLFFAEWAIEDENGVIHNISDNKGGGHTSFSWSQDGVYSVCYTFKSAFRGDTCQLTYCDSITVSRQAQCQAWYRVDSLNSIAAPNQIVIRELSQSNGDILQYRWDFGDGTIKTNQFPSHTYSQNGVYEVCLEITAVDSSRMDTCISTYCDSIGFDASGNMVFKDQLAGFTINVVDPASIGLDENLLEESLKMYPNPATEKVTLSWDPALKVERVSVFSLGGLELLSVKPYEASNMEIKDLPKGAYLVRIQAKAASKTLRLIVN
ncbi:PKD domain-containing protein [Croceimicrobium hydrocarbonivorans]|uniref:PKD domain-containing protein n=1 Tax=Croceimicrobium hydrocarbonivorans TaxID=2761580 RepID=A0A7H0VC05_9FLAO|nr:PKD domain-containing protein [Croceimicrobium hydrocarbonivorans]QNR23253.1 PKD domain-containing protein [Croceimicrobium hydrocarbonivorans]